MRAQCWIAGAAVSAAFLAGCGGSSHRTSGTGTTGALPPGASPALRGVFGRVLIAGEMQGFEAQGARVLGVNAASWIAVQKLPAGQRATETARLERLGFVGAVSERLVPERLLATPGVPTEAVSIVVEFRTARAARAELAAEAQSFKAGGISAEARPLKIPGGRGFVRVTPSSTEAVLFYASGPYFYRLNATHPPGFRNPPNLLDLIIAATQQYARLLGH